MKNQPLVEAGMAARSYHTPMPFLRVVMPMPCLSITVVIATPRRVGYHTEHYSPVNFDPHLTSRTEMEKAHVSDG